MGVWVAAFFTFGVSATMAFEEINTTFFGVAIKGYDPVAYHTKHVDTIFKRVFGKA